MELKTTFYEIKELSELITKPDDEKIILCDKLTAVEVLSICSDKHANHIVQKSNIKSDAELKLSSSMTNSPEMFIRFPLSVIMGAEHPTEQTEKERQGLSFFMTVPEDRESILSQIEQYIGKHCKRKSVIDDIRLAADELITNCLFNAPYVNKDNSNATVDRISSEISIDADKKPHIFAGFDANRVIIGCTDYYGRLNVRKLIERIKLCYVNNPSSMINYEAGGAGIGSYLIFDTCMSYYVAVDPEVATTICCAFPVNMSAVERNQIPKNIHIILND